MIYGTKQYRVLLELRYAHDLEAPGGTSHMKQTGMLVGNFEFNP